MSSSYPDFLCIGAQKAATTWLYDTIKGLPGLFLPAIKELHYFSELYMAGPAKWGPVHRRSQIEMCRKYFTKITMSDQARGVLSQLDHLDARATSDDWYRGIFDFAPEDTIRGEICPSYMNLPGEGVDHVMRINPDVRVLMIVRDPVDRMWSHIRMQLTYGSLDYEQLVSGRMHLGPFLLFTDYAGAFENWSSRTREGHLKAIVYDRIGEDPISVLNEVLGYIGSTERVSKTNPIKMMLSSVVNEFKDIAGALVEQRNLNPEKLVFVGPEMEFPASVRARLFDELSEQYDFLHGLYPGYVDAWVERHRSAMLNGV